jgi:hypothetical protein
MARAACFRCDWEGEAEGGACPNCGTTLYRPVERPPADHAPLVSPSEGRPAGTPRAEFLTGSASSDDPPSRSTRRSRPFAAFVAVAAVLTGSVWWFLRAHEVPEGVEAAAPPPSGHLVYYTAAGEGSGRLWSWDPRTDVASEGPALEGEVVQLVSAQGALAGWLGVTTRAPGGPLDASILRTQTDDAHPVHVVSGDLVAWGPNGAAVVAIGLGASTDGCHASVVVSRERLDRGVAERVLRLAPFCGEIPSLGQTLATTYFTVERGDLDGVYFLGNGEPHAVLGGWTMVSVSPTSDLLVQRHGGPGTALFWRGAVRPEPYLGTDGSQVVVRAVLTWTAGADGALVVATVGDREGLYLLDTTPGGVRVPRYVGPATMPVFATAAFDGSLYVAMQGRLLRYADERLAEVGLPDGAPRPDGPIAWMPG